MSRPDEYICWLFFFTGPLYDPYNKLIKDYCYTDQTHSLGLRFVTHNVSRKEKDAKKKKKIFSCLILY